MLPVAEHFHSLQGEGFWLGTQMHFIRLAGCSVGKKASNEFLKDNAVVSMETEKKELLPVLRNGTIGSKCKTWDGRFFDCDTDFTAKEHLTIQELIDDTWESHICLTGGEPLNHQRQIITQGLFMRAFERRIQIHIETSGTVQIDEQFYHDSRVWVTVSPKFDAQEVMIARADELKLLVDEQFDFDKIPASWKKKKNVFLSPINEEYSPIPENRDKTLEQLKKIALAGLPEWRYTPQLHKYLGLR